MVNYEEHQLGGTTERTADGTADGQQTVPDEVRVEGKKEKKEPKPSRNTSLAIAVPTEAMQTANTLADLVLQNLPNTAAMLNGKRDKTVAAWAQDIDKLNRIDGWTWEQIGYIVQWCQADDFWKGNIRSGAKLREKFEKLVLKAKSENTRAIPEWEKKYHELKARKAARAQA